MASPFKFFIETRDELQKVVWPSQKDVIRLTFVVIFISAITALYIGTLDFMFARLTQMLIK